MVASAGPENHRHPAAIREEQNQYRPVEKAHIGSGVPETGERRPDPGDQSAPL